MMIYSVELILTLIGILLLIYQYIACYIEKNRRKIFVLTIHGESLIYKYQDYFKNQVILYACIVMILFISPYEYAMIWCIGVLMIDFLLAYIIMFILDRKILLLERRGYYDYC